jgi:hypothetical protein
LTGKPLNSGTLQIRLSFGKTIGLVIGLLLLFVGIAEWAARLEAFQSPLTPPKMGSRHYQLGHKLALLEAATRKEGSMDCIMVGSSVVDRGFDPDAFENAYSEITGRNIRCFNFGIDASSIVSAGTLTRILVEDYGPRLLILGTDPRDYTLHTDDQDVAVIMNSPWIRYRSGDFSLEGWLLDHSYLYRYRQHLSRLVRFHFDNTLWSETQLNFPILPNGFTPTAKISAHVNSPPDPQDTSYESTYYTRLYSSYQILDENLEALAGIMDRNGAGRQVIVVEMPVSDGLYYFFGNGETDYNRYIASVNELANLHQIPFWRTEPLDSIPDNGWADYSHLNVTGARIFSAWLGEQVGTADVQGSFHVVVP